jgi:FkbM family methyltransferase
MPAMRLLRTAVEIIKLRAQKMGIAISYYPPPGSFKRQLKDFLSQMEINVVLDVGAFIGNYPIELREIGYKGRIISFEPVPSSYDRLSTTMRLDPLWCGQPFGLSDDNRDAMMNIYARGDFNSLLNLRKDPELAYSLDPSLRSKTPIQLRRLDAVLPRLIEEIRSPRVFLKMDTQGHDASVVKGAAGVLDKIVGLQSELPAVNIYDGMPSMSGTLEYYASCGFIPIGFYPENTFRNIKQIVPEFNVLFNRFEGSLYRL